MTVNSDYYVFIGVTADARRAVYYQPHEWAIRSIALDGGELEAVHAGAFEAEDVYWLADYVAAREADAWA